MNDIIYLFKAVFEAKKFILQSPDSCVFFTFIKVGREYYQGVINIINNARGERLKDITKQEEIHEEIKEEIVEETKETKEQQLTMSDFFEEFKI